MNMRSITSIDHEYSLAELSRVKEAVSKLDDEYEEDSTSTASVACSGVGYGISNTNESPSSSSKETLTAFAQRLNDLRTYKRKHGHVNVRKIEDQSLYDFCKSMRYARNNPEKRRMTLTNDRISSLDDLGFNWAGTVTTGTKIEVASSSSDNNKIKAMVSQIMIGLPKGTVVGKKIKGSNTYFIFNGVSRARATQNVSALISP